MFFNTPFIPTPYLRRDRGWGWQSFNRAQHQARNILVQLSAFIVKLSTGPAIGGVDILAARTAFFTHCTRLIRMHVLCAERSLISRGKGNERDSGTDRQTAV